MMYLRLMLMMFHFLTCDEKSAYMSKVPPLLISSPWSHQQLICVTAGEICRVFSLTSGKTSKYSFASVPFE